MSLDRLRRWFELTREEQLWVAGILAIFLIGLVARWYHAARPPPASPPTAPAAAIEPAHP